VLGRSYALLRSAVEGFIEDSAPSRGAAIAYYTLFSLAPLLVIATAVAGAAFGEVAVEGAVAAELQDLLGDKAAAAIQDLVRAAHFEGGGMLAGIISVVTLLLTASGAFGELQSALNVIWKAEPQGGTISRLVRARAASIGLVAATGFLLLVSLLASAAIAALGRWIGGAVTGLELVLSALNFTVSFLLIAALFAAIYKVLPDRPIAWRDVGVGALVTALLFVIGKSLIGWYLGGGGLASSYGAAGALMVVLLWVYYSAQVFLLGAEFTRAYAEGHGKKLEPSAAPAHA